MLVLLLLPLPPPPLLPAVLEGWGPNGDAMGELSWNRL